VKVLEIKTAEEAGFCFGVKRAIEMATGQIESQEESPVYTLGPIIHNPQVVKKLENLGIVSVDDLAEIDDGVIIIRSHGVEPEVIKQARDKGLTIIDATCPYVKKAQDNASLLISEGYQTLIYGDREHPEVKGILGATDYQAEIIQDQEDLEKIQLETRVGIVAQTTKSPASFRDLIARILPLVKELKIFNTICNTTQIRQRSAEKLAEEVEVMFVIGGFNSANTNRLVELCVLTGTPTYHIETTEDIDWNWLEGVKKIGITAGASTPDWLIKEVIQVMSQENKDLEKEELTLDEEKEEREIVEESEEKNEVEVKDEEVKASEDKEEAAEAETELEVEEGAEVEEKSPEKPEIEEAVEESDSLDGDKAPLEEPAEEPEVEAAEEEEESAEAAEVKIEQETEESSQDEEPVEEEVTGEEEEDFEEEEEEEEFHYSDNDIARLEKGQLVTGTVVEINEQGVYVDVNYKTDGFIPLRELSYSDVDDAHDLVSLDEEIKVVVLTLEDDDGNMILSKRRAEQEEAWDEIQEAYKNDEVIEATIQKEVKGGLVADVGLRGFIPASHVALGYVEDLSQYVGEEMRLKVIEVDRNNNNVVLSAKKVLEEEREKSKKETLEKLEKDQIITGRITKLVDFGAFVDLGGIEGLLHISEMSWGRIGHPSDVLEEGEEIEVKVLDVDREKERISLGYKQLLPDPWEEFARKHYEGEVILGKITKLVDFGAFMEIEDGIEGLIHISQLSHKHVKTPDEIVEVGEEREAKIINIDPEQKRVGLSLKELEDKPPAPEKKEQQKSSQSEEGEEKPEDMPSGATIGERLGDLKNLMSDDTE